MELVAGRQNMGWMRRYGKFFNCGLGPGPRAGAIKARERVRMLSRVRAVDAIAPDPGPHPQGSFPETDPEPILGASRSARVS
jgi:hypothetical protein